MRILFYTTGLLGILLLGACRETKKTSQGPVPDIASIEVSDDNPNSYILRAKAYSDVGDYRSAIRDAVTALSIDSLNADYYHVLADAYLDGAESRQALATMDKVTKMYPTRIPSLLKYAEFQYILKQYDNSIHTVNHLLRHDNLNAEAFFMLGLNLHAKGDIEVAKKALQTSVENNPEIVDAWILLAELHETSDPSLAETYYNNAIEVSKNSSQARHSLAYFYQNSNRISEAIQLYRQISTDDPSYIPSYMNAGILYMELDSLDKAYEQFDIIVAREVQNAKGYYLRSQVSLLRGDLDRALEDINTSLRLHDNGTEAMQLKQKVENLIKER